LYFELFSIPLDVVNCDPSHAYVMLYVSRKSVNVVCAQSVLTIPNVNAQQSSNLLEQQTKPSIITKFNIYIEQVNNKVCANSTECRPAMRRSYDICCHTDALCALVWVYWWEVGWFIEK